MTNTEQSSSARARSAAFILGAFLLWVAGIMVLFPPLSGASKGTPNEAKAALTEFASAQIATFAQSGQYSYDLNMVAYRPSPSMTYVIAFAPACASRFVKDSNAMTNTLQLASRSPASTPVKATPRADERVRIEAALSSLDRFECRDPKEGFVAYAIGNLDNDDDLDIWSIDQKNEVKHIQADH